MVMADSSALKFLVRRRTTFTWMVPLALLAATFYWGRWNLITYLAGAVLLVLGEVVRFWAAGYIHKDDSVATGGPYGLVRNPLYFGSLLLAVGFALMSGIGLPAWVAVIGLFLVFHLAAIISEERFLKQKFGEPYESYLKLVPRLIPMPRFGRSESTSGEGRGFSMRQAIFNREHTTATVTFLTAIMFLAIELFRHYRPGF